MSNMSERISQCIKDSGLTKTAFASTIKVSQPFVSQLCAGVATPSDRTISDICRKYGINETWLRTGEGDMHINLSRNQEVANLVSDFLNGEPDTFKGRFVTMLARLDESDWVVLEKMVEEMKKTKP